MKKLAIFGVPRSGTSWLSQIFNAHPEVVMRFQPLFSYGHKGRLSECASANEIYSFFDEILNSEDAFALMHADMHKSYPSFYKSDIPTHIAFKETRYMHTIENMLRNCKHIRIIGIVRNPLAVIASWIQAPREFMAEWNIQKEWKSAPSKNDNRPEEFYGFDKWKAVAESFIRFENIYPQQFKMIRYYQLNADTFKVVNDFFEFCDLDVHAQVSQFIEASKSVHNSDPYSVFKSKSCDNHWRDVLPADIVEAVYSDLSNSPLQTFLAEHE